VGQCNDSLWTRWSGDGILVGAKLGVKRTGHGVDHPLPSMAKVKERVELCISTPLGFHGLL